ncbi:MAG: DegT/DnrJ/EryC1/StrS family aminotransferase [Gammaproteobacteria bacterium]|jgi:dTDP-4-amino-4,6-dideoxygalactose transaminase|nr:DegT/DnrJ/EryC1/StrS family aminotransferase [Gammaproteobacteria bacterium]
MIKFLDLHTQYLSIKDEIDAAMAAVISESAFIGGKYVKQFEENFADYQHAKFCVGVANGTDALEIAIEALNLPKGSEIIVPANSFIASAEAVTRTGHKVVFCDARAVDYTINLEDVKKRITPNTVAIIAVHLYGHPCDMDPLLELAQQYNLKVIEDCAQAHGAEYKGKKVGAIGNVGCFSFYPGKNLGAYGDGGAIVTNDESLATKCRMIANHGRIAKYDHEFEGRNSRLDGLQAAILNVKLRYLDTWTEHRIMIADEYLKQLKSVTEIILPVRQEWAKQVYHLFVIRHPNRDLLKAKLNEAGIQIGVHYPIALPKMKAFQYVGQAGENGFAWDSGGELLSLPIGDHLNTQDVEKIARLLIN